MKVDGVNFAQNAAAKSAKNAQIIEEQPPAEAQTPQTEETTQAEENVKGVIRLLQEGHFKGVADVRLRINFHDELAALEAQNLKAAAANGFVQFDQTVVEQLITLSDSGLLDDDQAAAVDSFSTDIQTAQNEFIQSENNSVASLLEALQNKFDSLMALLNPPASTGSESEVDPDVILEEPTSQLPADQTPTETLPEEEDLSTKQITTETFELQEEATEEPNPLLQLVKSFQEAFQAALENLESQLTETSSLPPVSEPSGNGKAYAKFMAIYENMLAGTSVETDPAEQLDIQEPPAPEESPVVTEPEQ